MRWLLTLLVLANCMAIAMADTVARAPVFPRPLLAVAGSVTVLCYHEVRDDVRDYPDPFAVDSAALVRQFAWLRENAYVPVRLDDIVAARSGGKPLPAKAVLLSFDDGYLSFYTRVYPLLREFGFPAVLGVVGKWIEQPAQSAERYGEKGTVVGASFPTWGQLREMAASGLVEIASHTYDLHRGVPANPQGNLQPAATARIHHAASGAYEDDAHWRARVRADLARNADLIERETGRRPRAIVWPYGSYNDELVRIAGELGMGIGLTLIDGINTPAVPLTALRRILIEHNPSLAEFALEVRGPLYTEPLRVVQVKLDDVVSADPAQQERKLSALLERILVLKPTHVYLRATSDTQGDGGAHAAYFPNRHLPLRADLFNRVAWQLASRVDVKVYAVMPMTAIGLPQDRIVEVYEDLARNAPIDGLVFDDNTAPGSADSASSLPQDAGSFELTERLAARARAFRAPLKTVRTTRSVQDLAGLAAQYDYVALIGRADGSSLDPERRRDPVFILPGAVAPARQMRALQLGGALNFGYAPDDFAHDRPALADTAPAMSLRVNPLPPGAARK